MARIDPDDVRLILDTSLTDDQLETFITAGHLLVNRLLVGRASYSTAELTEIERWLSAHLATAREKQITSESIGGASASYGFQAGLGLDGSPYGQQVRILDTEGILASLGRRKANIKWLGR